jgi:hypothetical protein
MMQHRKWLLTVVAALGIMALAGFFRAADAAEKKVQMVVPGCSS